MELRVRLEPASVFGEGDADFPLAITDETFSVTYNGNVGRVGIRREVPLPLIAVTLNALGGEIRLRGGLLTLEYLAPSLADATERLETLRLLVPPILSMHTPSPIAAAVATVKIGEVEHYLVLKQLAFNLDVTSVVAYEDRLARCLNSFENLVNPSTTALLMAFQYVHVALRLSDAGASPWEFAAEIMLNCAKAVEALFGPNREDIRSGLYKLKVPAEEVEGVFIPLMLLRNEWDVGHAKATPIPSTHFAAVYEFVHEVPRATQDLLKLVTSSLAEGNWGPRQLTIDASPMDETKFRKLTKSMNDGLKFRRDRANNLPT